MIRPGHARAGTPKETCPLACRLELLNVTDRRLFVALLVPLGVLAACSSTPASRADSASPSTGATATATTKVTTTHTPASTDRATATHRPGVGGAAATASASAARRRSATPTRTVSARPPTTHPKAAHPKAHASPTRTPKHPPVPAHPPTHPRVTHAPVVVTVPCPPSAAILKAAKAGNGGALPPDVRIVATRCTGRYVAGLLSSEAGAGSMLLARTGATLHLVTVGGVICPNPTVHRLPQPIRKFLHC